MVDDPLGSTTRRRAIATASFKILDVEVVGHVLEDGTRVVDADSMSRVMEAMADPERGGRVDLLELQRFCDWQQAR